MTETEKTPECQLDEHALCAGPRTIRRPGAPAWEAPIMTVHCGCNCHQRRKPTQASPASSRRLIREG